MMSESHFCSRGIKVIASFIVKCDVFEPPMLGVVQNYHHFHKSTPVEYTGGGGQWPMYAFLKC